MKSKLMISRVLSLSLLASLTAQAAVEMPGQIFVPDNKQVSAWKDGKLEAAAGSDMLRMEPERAKNSILKEPLVGVRCKLNFHSSLMNTFYEMDFQKTKKVLARRLDF